MEIMAYHDCYLSGHSLQRAKERCGIKNAESASRHISLAYERGRRAEDCRSWERSYLESYSERNAEAVAYDGFCYLFSMEGVCITLFKLPGWFEEKSISMERNESEITKNIVEAMIGILRSTI